jgi:RNA recognition motif-containing protein
MTIYLGNIPYDASEESLFEVLSKFGQVFDLNYPIDSVTGKYRGFAFLTISDPAKAEEAIRSLNGSDFGGRPMKASIAKPQNVPPSQGIPIGFRRMGENPFQQQGGRRR